MAHYDELVTPKDRPQLQEPLHIFLERHGYSVEDYNNYLKAAVASANGNMREAYVKAAMAITYDFEQKFGYRFPYTFGGGHIYLGSNPDLVPKYEEFDKLNGNYKNGSTLGVNPNWGTKFNDKQMKLFTHQDGTVYTSLGLDCSSFVSWAAFNTGQVDYFEKNAQSMAHGYVNQQTGIQEFIPFGTLHAINTDFFGRAGDIIWRRGHVMSIVAADETNGIYYTAEPNCGAEGTKIYRRPIESLTSDSREHFIIDMDNFFKEPNEVARKRI